MSILPTEDKKDYLLLLILLVIGSFFRFYNLGHIFLWGDDPLHQVRIAYQSLGFVLAHNNQTALSTLLAHFLLPFGKIELMARLGSAICGVLSIVVIYLVGKTMFSRQEGLMAAVFVTFSPFLIHFSQYSRAYALFTLLSLFLLYFFYRAMKENNLKGWVFYCLFTMLAVYNHLVALLILPALAVFAGIGWLKGPLNQKAKLGRPIRKIPLANFVLWTFLALLLATLLYLPNPDVRDFLSGSLKRTVSPREDVSNPYFLLNDILRSQIAPEMPFFYALTLLFLGLAFVGSLKRYPQSIILSVLYLVIPWVIFVSVNPRTTNLFSADRFFIFILPIVFLLAARGIDVSSAFLGSLFRPRKLVSPSPRWLKQILCLAMVLVMAGGYAANFRSHYLLHWRFGSFRFDKEEMNFFRRHLKKDALLYLDIFPLSSTLVVMSPLEKGIKLEEVEFIIRDSLDVGDKETDFMVYQIDWAIFEIFVASRNADLWMVTKLDGLSSQRLLSLVQQKPGIYVYSLPRYSILHFSDSHQSIAQKMALMSDIFLSLPIEKIKEKQFHWLAAKANLMVDGLEQYSKHFQAAQKIKLVPREIKTENLPKMMGILDKLFCLRPERLLEIYQQRVFKEIQSLLFLFGNNCLDRGEVETAAQAYRECLEVGDEWDRAIMEKIPLLKDNFRTPEQNPSLISLLEKVLELDPERFDLWVFLGEAYRREGDLARAGELYRKMLGMPALPPDFFPRLEEVPQSLLFWEKGSDFFVLLMSQEDSVISGRIRSSQNILAVEKVNFVGEDSLLFSRDKIRFQARLNKGQNKLMRFKVPHGARLNFDIKVNGFRDPRKIILLPEGTRPSRIPFEIVFSSSK